MANASDVKREWIEAALEEGIKIIDGNILATENQIQTIESMRSVLSVV